MYPDYNVKNIDSFKDLLGIMQSEHSSEIAFSCSSGDVSYAELVDRILKFANGISKVGCNKIRLDFNHRQKALLAQMLKNPEMATSVTAHCREFQTVRQTARTDLNTLVTAGMLTVRKAGNEFIYSPAANLQKLICG